MARFSIGEDDEDAPIVNKRPRFSEPASQSQPRSQRSVRPQPSVVTDEDEEEELIPIEDVESDSQGFEEEEDDEDDEFEAEAEEDEDEDEDVDIEEHNVQHTDVEPVSDVQNRQQDITFFLNLGLPNVTSPIRSSSTAPPVFNNTNGALQVVLTDPDVLDCPICLDPLCSPVFQCENGHIACSSCCHKIKRKCPSCCMPIGYNRCRAIEKVLESIKVSCKNTQQGCKKTFPYNKKTQHEQSCPHATCHCPHATCRFTGSSKNLYLHHGSQHASSTTRFTYNTTFTLRVESTQKHIFLQEQNESVIFILNHEVKQHAHAFNVDCVGPNTLKSSFSYQLTAKNLETSLSLQSVPEIYLNWSEHTPRKNYLTVPSEFVGYLGVLSLHVCIKKVVI